MDWLSRMNNAISYIEEHLLEKVDYEEAARCACCSVYQYQRMFSFITDVSLSEYVRRRRLTLAALELQNGSLKVIDLALKYGYESPEAFTRAFQALHGVSPTQARSKGVTLKAYPRLSFHISIRGDVEMNYRIEDKEAFTMYGVERIFDMENGQNLAEIPLFWQNALQDGTVDQLAKSTGDNTPYLPNLCPVNALCGHRHTGGTTFPYMLAAFKTPSSCIEGYQVAEVPAATWAIFTTEEHTSEQTSDYIQSLTRRIYSEWLPTSNYDHYDGYDLEMYYEKDNGMSLTEVWLRVTPKN